ncbi:MAG: tetratricopeptide repeat protein [Planctomycetota bacterium]
MEIRKEPALFLVVLALGAWMVISAKSSGPPTRISPDYQDYEAAAAPVDPMLASGAAAAAVPAAASAGQRDPFLEPSETRPLPPRPLPFPALAPLPLVAPPLDPGPAPGAFAVLRVTGEVEPFDFSADAGAQGTNGSGGGGVAGAGSGAGASVAVVNGAANGQDPSHLRDRLVLSDGRTLSGYVRNEARFAMHGKRPTEPVSFDFVGRDGKIAANETYPAEEVVRVELADTLRNRIYVRRLTLSSGPASLPNRREFVDDLLRDARSNVWIYPVALEEADRYIGLDGGSADGYRLKARVLRERGDLAAQWQLFSELPQALQGSAFQLAGQAQLEARLGLVLDAEAHMEQAAEAAPENPYVRLAAAQFWLAQGEIAAARDHAQAARRNAVALTSDRDRFEIDATILSCQLALGAPEEARTALTRMTSGEGLRARRDYLKGCLEYTAGRRAEAVTAFTGSVSASQAGVLGLGLCRALEGRWVEAVASFQAIVDADPVVRHRALGALGFVYLRTGNHQQAVAPLEEAVRADPGDAYAWWLLGRARRLSGDDTGAVEALEEALQRSDDFVEAAAEIAMTYLERSDHAGAEAAELLYRARRFADRALELEEARGEAPEIAYVELAAVARYRTADRRGARTLFESGAERSLSCRAGVALVEYGLGRVQDGRGLLQEMIDDLRSGDPTRAWAEATVALIDDHTEKEQLADSFDRDDLGTAWKDQVNGRLKPMLQGDALRIAGTLEGAAKPVYARRVQPTAGNFLATSVSLQLGGGDDSKFTGLQISTATSRGRSAADFQARLGFLDGRPAVVIEDGDAARARDDEERAKWDPVRLDDVAADRTVSHRLEFRVVERDGGKQFALQAVWNDVVVHQRDVEKLSRTSRTEMPVDLLVEGRQGARVEATFDDFRLVRRREE